MSRYVIILLCLLATGCATVGRTKDLQPGMSQAQVKNVLGEPSQAQFIANHIVWKYSLSQGARGHIPYYLVFDPATQQLQEWFASEAEYTRNQLLWRSAFPTTQNYNVNIRQQ